MREPPSFRGDAKHRAMGRPCAPENLEIPRCAIAHLWSGPSDYPGMTVNGKTECCNLPPMEWTDEGIVLGVRRHGESSAIAELLTREHGRHLGLVRGGASSRMRPLLQPGNSVNAIWRARLDEHLGTFALEGTRLRAAGLLASPHAVYRVT